MDQLIWKVSQTIFAHLHSLLSVAMAATALPPPEVGHRGKDRTRVVFVLVCLRSSRHDLHAHQAVGWIPDGGEEQPGRGLPAGGNDPDRQRDTNFPSVEVGREAAGDFLS